MKKDEIVAIRYIDASYSFTKPRSLPDQNYIARGRLIVRNKMHSVYHFGIKVLYHRKVFSFLHRRLFSRERNQRLIIRYRNSCPVDTLAHTGKI